MNEDKVNWYEQAPIVSGSRNYEREYPITMKQVLTLRDQFAMAALTGLLSNPEYSHTTSSLSKQAYYVADEMLAEREPKK